MNSRANDEMVLGYSDGYNLTSPEPTENRSVSYRHGFKCARIDKGLKPRESFKDLVRQADEAMAADAASCVD